MFEVCLKLDYVRNLYDPYTVYGIHVIDNKIHFLFYDKRGEWYLDEAKEYIPVVTI
jgi:hypothetical protein